MLTLQMTFPDMDLHEAGKREYSAFPIWRAACHSSFISRFVHWFVAAFRFVRSPARFVSPLVSEYLFLLPLLGLLVHVLCSLHPSGDIL